MNKQKTLTLWAIGLLCTLVWFWGDKAGIPPSAINLAAWVVPGLLAYALKSSEAQTTADGNKAAPNREPVLAPAQGPIEVAAIAAEPITIPASGPINVPQEPQA